MLNMIAKRYLLFYLLPIFQEISIDWAVMAIDKILKINILKEALSELKEFKGTFVIKRKSGNFQSHP